MQNQPVAIERLDPQQYRQLPWKNGGGVTVDIASALRPGGAPDDAWRSTIWRFGRTRIERAGPFSDLAGFDRSLAVIDGRGLILRPAAAPPIDVRQPFRPVTFPGEWPIVSELEAGGVGVLNLMADRRHASAELRFLTAAEDVLIEGETVILYAPKGEASVVAGQDRLGLDEDEAILIRGSKALGGNTLRLRQAQGIIAVAAIGSLRKAQS